MRKALLLISILLCGLLVLALAGLLAVQLLYPPSRVKALLIAAARAKLHRELRIDSLGYSGWGLRVRGVSLSRAPDFSKGQQLAAEALVLRPAWIAVFSGRLPLAHIEADGLRVSVTRDRDGRLDIADLSESSGTARAGRAAAATYLGLLHTLVLRDARFSFTDDSQALSLSILARRARLNSFSVFNPFPMSFDADAVYASSATRYEASIQAAGAADLAGGHGTRMAASFPELAAVVNGVAVRGSVSLADARSPNLQASLSCDDADWETLASILPFLGRRWLKGRTSFAVKLQGPLLEPSVDVPELTLRALPYKTDGWRVPSAVWDASASYDKGTLALRRVTWRGAGVDAALSGVVSGLDGNDPALDLKLHTNRFQLAPLSQGEPTTNYALAGAASADAALGGTVSKPRLSGSLLVEGAAARVEGQLLEATTGQIVFSGDSFDAPFAGRLNGGDFKLEVAGTRHPASVKVTAWASALNLNPLPENAFQEPRSSTQTLKDYSIPEFTASGDLAADSVSVPHFTSGRARVAWDLGGVSPDLSRLYGAIRLGIGPGHITGLSEGHKRSNLLRSLFLPLEALNQLLLKHIPGLAVPSLKDVPFRSIVGDYIVNKGVASLKPCSLEGRDVSWKTTGTLDLPQQRANLRSAVQWGLLSLDLKISGPFSDLSVRTNLAKSVGKEGLHILELPERLLLSPFHRL